MAENNQTKSKARGGKREGAGRKPGSANVKTREIANKAAESGMSPLEVMLEAMATAYKAGGAVAAFGFAKDAAPYVHAKIAAVEHSGPNGGAIETENRWIVELVRPGGVSTQPS